MWLPCTPHQFSPLHSPPFSAFAPLSSELHPFTPDALKSAVYEASWCGILVGTRYKARLDHRPELQHPGGSDSADPGEGPGFTGNGPVEPLMVEQPAVGALCLKA